MNEVKGIDLNVVKTASLENAVEPVEIVSVERDNVLDKRDVSSDIRTTWSIIWS